MPGYPTRDFREWFRYCQPGFFKPRIAAAVATHPRGNWEIWPDHVIALNPPKSLEDHAQVEMIGGRTTWTLFMTSKENIKMGDELKWFLSQHRIDVDGPGMVGPFRVKTFFDLPIWNVLTSNRLALVRKAYASRNRMSARDWARRGDR